MQNWMANGWWKGWAGLIGMALLSGGSACAQVIGDDTLAIAERSQVSPGPTMQITGGAVRGSNLFHSFLQFSIPTGGSVVFNNGAAIANIISRVTGTAPSVLDGTLQANGTANLFLINPNGIVFGPKATLNIGGSFLATTATAIQFGNQGSFSATSPEVSALLSVNPSALLFNQITHAAGITHQATLTVRPENTLTLVGGALNLDGGKLVAPAGRVELAAIAGTGTVGLDRLSLTVPAALARADIQLTNGAALQLQGTAMGNVAIYARDLNLTASTIATEILDRANGSGRPPGGIGLDATGAIRLAQASQVRTLLGRNATGRGGDIAIRADSLSVTGVSVIGALTSGIGDSGNIAIQVSDRLLIDGAGRPGDRSLIKTEVTSTGNGNSGSIAVIARTLATTNGGEFTATTVGRGNAGSVTLQVTEDAVFDGVGGEGPSGVISTVGSTGVGRGGDITVRAQTIALTNAAQLASNANGRGNAGNITLEARERVSLDGTIASGDSSGVFSGVGGAGRGNGGDILVIAPIVSLTRGGQLLALTFGDGSAGNVILQADEVLLDGTGFEGQSGIFTGVIFGATGRGGNIDITTRSLSITNGALLSATTAGEREGGNITIHAADSTWLDGSGELGPSSLVTDAEGLLGILGLLSTSEIRNPVLRIPPRALGSTTLRVAIATAELFPQVVSIAPNRDFIIDTTRLRNALEQLTVLRPDLVPAGRGGEISVTTGSLTLSNGAQISASSEGTGTAGRIRLAVRDSLHIQGGVVSTSALRSTGGEVVFTAKDIRLSGDSDITTSVFRGEGEGGNITFTAESIIMLDDSDILAFSRDGSGGNITLEAPVFFGSGYQPTIAISDLATLDGNGRVDINATGRLRSGVIRLPDTSELQNRVVRLPNSVLDSSRLIQNSCMVRRTSQGSFVITGIGGLPVSPAEIGSAPFSTYDVEPIVAAQPNPLPPVTEHRSNSSPAPMVEIDGVYPLSTGEIILGRACR